MPPGETQKSRNVYRTKANKNSLQESRPFCDVNDSISSTLQAASPLGSRCFGSIPTTPPLCFRSSGFLSPSSTFAPASEPLHRLRWPLAAQALPLFWLHLLRSFDRSLRVVSSGKRLLSPQLQTGPCAAVAAVSFPWLLQPVTTNRVV